VTRTVHTEHRTLIAAPAESVYQIVADVTRWPLFFRPTVHARVLERDNDQEIIRLWAFANDEVRTWTSRRRLDPHALRVEFRQTNCTAPIASMRGEWLLKPVDATSTTVAFGHEYRAVDDDPGHAAWIAEAVERNSNAELAALKAAAENHDRMDELVLSFDDTVPVDGSAYDVYEFLFQAQEWPRRLPHVSRLDLREDVAGAAEEQRQHEADDRPHQRTTAKRLTSHSDPGAAPGTASKYHPASAHTSSSVLGPATRCAGTQARVKARPGYAGSLAGQSPETGPATKQVFAGRPALPGGTPVLSSHPSRTDVVTPLSSQHA